MCVTSPTNDITNLVMVSISKCLHEGRILAALWIPVNLYTRCVHRTFINACSNNPINLFISFASNIFNELQMLECGCVYIGTPYYRETWQGFTILLKGNIQYLKDYLIKSNLVRPYVKLSIVSQTVHSTLIPISISTTKL